MVSFQRFYVDCAYRSDTHYGCSRARPSPLQKKWSTAPSSPIVIFTDGACEGLNFQKVSVGAVIFLPNGVVEAFGVEVQRSVTGRWAADRANGQTIGQAEIYPVVLAKATWSHYIRDRKVVYFVDNDSARYALIRKFSPSRPSSELLWEAAKADAALGSASWCARVPSPSNVADGPSRLKFEQVTSEFGAVLVEPRVPRACR